jgi:hypothetical protein
MNFPALPSAYPRFFVVVIVALDPGPHTVRLRILDPAGLNILGDEGADVQVESTGGDTNLVVDFNNLPFERPGIYQVQLVIEGSVVQSLPLVVQGGSAGSATAQAN